MVGERYTTHPQPAPPPSWPSCPWEQGTWTLAGSNRSSTAVIWGCQCRSPSSRTGRSLPQFQRAACSITAHAHFDTDSQRGSKNAASTHSQHAQPARTASMHSQHTQPTHNHHTQPPHTATTHSHHTQPPHTATTHSHHTHTHTLLDLALTTHAERGAGHPQCRAP